MSETTNLGLPYIAAGQAQKHVTHNEALRQLDMLVHVNAHARNLATPPPAPLEGDTYVVAANATDDWLTKENHLAAFHDGAWMFQPFKPGLVVWLAGESVLTVWNGADWIDLQKSGVPLDNLASLGINTASDQTNKLAVASSAVLFTHDGNDMRHTLNKKAAADTASFLFQTNWSGRAEFGLTGSDDFRIKMSADGNNWSEALFIRKSTASVTIGQYVEDNLNIRGSFPALTLQDRAGGAQGDFINTINPDFGTGRKWGDVAALFHKWDAAGGVYSGNITGIGWNGENAERPYFYDKNTARGEILTTLKPNLASYIIADLPSATSSGAGAIVFVSDETGGATIAFSDGTNWRRTSDRAVVS